MAEKNDFRQMSKEEKDTLTYETVMGQFLFAKTIARSFGGRQENK